MTINVEDYDYFAEITAEGLLSDIRSMLVDGDNMTPEGLISDIQFMTRTFMIAHGILEEEN